MVGRAARIAISASVIAGCSSPDFSIADAYVDGGSTDTRETPPTDVARPVPASCKELHGADPAAPSGVYPLRTGGVDWTAYCEMDSEGGGWTLLLKADGSKSTFSYTSTLWTSTDVINAGAPSTERVEAKYAGFHLMPLKELRVGLIPVDTEGEPRWLVWPIALGALREAFGGGPRKVDGPGSAAWIGLNPRYELETTCVVEGFDLAGIQRLGIVGDDNADCASPASRIGVGGLGLTATGNVCTGTQCTGAAVRVPSFAWILAR